MWEKTAERFMRMVTAENGNYANPVLWLSGSAKIQQYTRKDGTPGRSLSISVSDFHFIRNRSGSCMDPNAQQQAPQGYQSSFGAPLPMVPLRIRSPRRSRLLRAAILPSRLCLSRVSPPPCLSSRVSRT